MKLREYQINTIKELYDYIRANKGRNPCLVLPTGAGKSVIIAKIAEDFHRVSKGKLIMLTHVSELVEQNYQKVKQYVNENDIGIYSNQLKRKELDRKITFANIQSIGKKETPNYSVIIIDEVHLVNTEQMGLYREFISKHENALVIGLTATPFRMRGGYINASENSIIHDLIYPSGTSILELVNNGFLSKLKSKVSELEYDFSNVKKSKGDFNEKQVNDIINNTESIEEAVKDIISRTCDKKHILVFCAGVEHSQNVAMEFVNQGQNAFAVHGGLTNSDRNFGISCFKKGDFRFLTNPNILTTGFDFPNIDCVVMLRPTMSTALYVQIVGRGMRLKDHIDHCLILDYVGNIERHGAITALNIKDKKPSTKRCPQCFEVVESSCLVCPDCGFGFKFKNPNDTKKEKKEKELIYGLSEIDIMEGQKPSIMNIEKWEWDKYTKSNGESGIVCVLRSIFINIKPVNVFYPIASEKAFYPCVTKIQKIFKCMGLEFNKDFWHKTIKEKDFDLFISEMSRYPAPSQVEYLKQDKYYNVVNYIF